MVSADIMFGPIAATFIIGITTLILLIWYSTIKQSYWKKKGIPYVKPLPLLGNIMDQTRFSQHQMEVDRYRKYGPVYGHYEGNRPVLSVADTKLLRDIFVKEFQAFPSRRTFAAGDAIMDKMISVLEGEDWKRIRTIISPTFSTGKLKRVLSIFKDCTRTLVQNFKMSAMKGEPVNAKKLFGALTMDVIASSAFSTKIDSHNNPENKFVQTAKQAFGTTLNWRFVGLLLCPGLMSFFKIPVFKPSVIKFFSTLTVQIIEERKKSGQVRNDFLQLLIDTTKEVAKEEKWEEEDKENDLDNYGEDTAAPKLPKSTFTKKLSIDELVAQCVIFFLAGYDTTATTLSFASYSLATNEDVQEKARQEIADCLKETNGELTYEALQKMKYLDNIISETLRLFPPLARLERKAESDFKLGDTGITVPKDMIVGIPANALHRDPKYFPDPEKFDPNRFTPEERAKRDPYAYLPFGAGPRNCVGMRFALLEIKMCLAYVITCFNIKTCPQTQIPVEFYVGTGLLQPKDILLQMEIRENCPLLE